MESNYYEKIGILTDETIIKAKRLIVLKTLFPKVVINGKNIFEVLMYIHELEVKYKGISNSFNKEVAATENSKLISVILSLNDIEITDDIGKGFLNSLILQGNHEQLYSKLLENSEVKFAIDEFYDINSKSFTENFSAEVVKNSNNINPNLVTVTKKYSHYSKLL